MPNESTHKAAGVAIACATPLLFDKDDDYSLIEYSSFAIAGYGFGAFPDIIEPALHPNHRGFFHSMIFAALLSFIGYIVSERIQEKKNELKKEGFDSQRFILMLLLVIIIAYVFHLILDGFTKKGLPLA